MNKVNTKTVNELIELSKLLGEFGEIKRATLLPNGEQETDSHHSFSLALIAYELACKHAPELNLYKILLYALVHDLTELITGDVVTLITSDDELKKKAENDSKALIEAKSKLQIAPNIYKALKNYEHKVDDESLFVYWIDKMITIPTHFYDNGSNLHKLGINNRSEIEKWYKRVLNKLNYINKKPHNSAVEILELAYKKMYDELLED